MVPCECQSSILDWCMIASSMRLFACCMPPNSIAPSWTTYATYLCTGTPPEGSTAPLAMSKLPDASALVQEADVLLRSLVDMLKAPAVSSLPGPVTIAVIKAVSYLGLQRPNFLGKVLPTLMALATQVCCIIGICCNTVVAITSTYLFYTSSSAVSCFVSLIRVVILLRVVYGCSCNMGTHCQSVAAPQTSRFKACMLLSVCWNIHVLSPCLV